MGFKKNLPEEVLQNIHYVTSLISSGLYFKISMQLCKYEEDLGKEIGIENVIFTF